MLFFVFYISVYFCLQFFGSFPAREVTVLEGGVAALFHVLDEPVLLLIILFSSGGCSFAGDRLDVYKVLSTDKGQRLQRMGAKG